MKLNYNNKRSRKKYQPQKYIMPRNPIVTVLEHLLSLVYILAVLFISLHPDFENFSKKTWFIILAVVITIGIHLFYAIAEKEREHPSFAVAMLLAIPIYLLYLFCDGGRLYQAIYTLLLPVYTYLFVVYAVYQKDRSREPGDFPIALALMMVYIQATNTWHVSYINESTQNKYLLISFAGAIIGVIMCIGLLKRGILRFENVSSNYLALFFAFLICGAIVFTFANSANYCLDTSDPIVYESEILSKEQLGSGKHTSYHINVEIDDKTIEFRTGLKSFTKANEEGKVKVYLYDGFLGDGYYILDLNQ